MQGNACSVHAKHIFPCLNFVSGLVGSLQNEIQKEIQFLLAWWRVHKLKQKALINGIVPKIYIEKRNKKEDGYPSKLIYFPIPDQLEKKDK